MRDFLTRIAQPFEWHEAGSQEADRLLGRHGAPRESLPVVVDGDDVIVGATAVRLARAWDVRTLPSRAHYDLAIVDAEPG
ncbi:MAG: hypothetical protein ACLGIA_08120 [Actinomycetes bacterium]